MTISIETISCIEVDGRVFVCARHEAREVTRSEYDELRGDYEAAIVVEGDVYVAADGSGDEYFVPAEA